jgi:hypothetical protein
MNHDCINKRSILVCVSAMLLLLSACIKNNEPLPCQSFSLQASALSSAPCAREGAIVITTPVGPGHLYSINYGAFQTNPIFDKLPSGNHIIVVQTEQNCRDTAVVRVSEPAPGPLFAAVKSVFSQYCMPCHGGSSPFGNVNLTVSCDIVRYWERIEARAVYGISSPMPQGGLIPVSERNKIIQWIQAGHRFSD